MKPGRKFLLLFLSLLLVIGPFFWTVDVGDRTLSTTEAWKTGIVQIAVAMGTLLLVLEIFLWRGALWPRWAIVFRCPFDLVSRASATASSPLNDRDISRPPLGPMRILLTY
jgi:hypothetical protein